nr:hypothetical protein GCM10020092_011390 [Actinoplanes digitatis]
MGSSPYADLDRPPLTERALERALVVPGALWRRVEVRAETGSTNADAAAAARDGAGEGLVIVAEQQVAGRGAPGPAVDLAAARRADAQRPAAARRRRR